MRRSQIHNNHIREYAVVMLMSLCVIVNCTHVVAADTGQVNAFEWRKASPSSQGMDRAKLDAMKDSLAGRHTKALLVVRNDRIVYEWYRADHGPNKRHYTASMAKALVGGVSLAVAIGDGRIGLDDKAAEYIPQWRNEPAKSKITIRHLGSHTSGIEDAEADDLPHDKLTGWKGDFWKRLAVPNDPFSISRDKSPLLFEPGSAFQYSNPGIALLGYAITTALGDAPEKDLRTLLRNRIMRPIGVLDSEWSVGYGKVFTVDGLPLVATWGGGNYTARALARVGRLMLHKGNWEGVQLISAKAVRITTSSAGLPGENGMGWWTNADGRFAPLPRDAFWASGAGHQTLLVVPSLNLICVRNGGPLSSNKAEYRKARGPYLFSPLMDAITDTHPGNSQTKTPYPQSTFIRGVEFNAATIDGVTSGDQWAPTWADDGNLYSAWGDGTGFGYRGGWNNRWTTYLGVPRIEGNPPDHKGYNVWGGYQAESEAPAYYRNLQLNENLKPNSSLICIDGILYMWPVRKQAGAHGEWSLSRLHTSADHGRTWTDHGVLFEESKGRFANVFTIQYGRDYTGLPSFQGDYVYLYGMENNDKTMNKDLLLSRCHKDRLNERNAYEFFSGTLDKPSWTSDLSEAGSVFHADIGISWWASCTYNNSLQRYILLTTHPPFEGRYDDHKGFGMFESQRPWGPWKTVVYTEDVGTIIRGMTEGISYAIPSKWISDDGKTMWMVFSGRPSDPFYSFNLIKLKLQLTN